MLTIVVAGMTLAGEGIPVLEAIAKALKGSQKRHLTVALSKALKANGGKRWGRTTSAKLITSAILEAEPSGDGPRIGEKRVSYDGYAQFIDADFLAYTNVKHWQDAMALTIARVAVREEKKRKATFGDANSHEEVFAWAIAVVVHLQSSMLGDSQLLPILENARAVELTDLARGQLISLAVLNDSVSRLVELANTFVSLVVAAGLVILIIELLHV